MLSLNARLFLTALYDHTLREERLRTTYMAQKLNISKAGVTEISRALKNEGYINYEPYQPYELTQQGLIYTRKLFERICIIEKFYFVQFKLNPYRASTEAVKSEPGISDIIVAAMHEQIPAPEISLFGHLLKESVSYKIKLLKSCTSGLIVRPIALNAKIKEYHQQFWQVIAGLMGKPLLINSIEPEIEAMQIIVENQPQHISFKLAEKIYVATQESLEL